MEWIYKDNAGTWRNVSKNCVVRSPPMDKIVLLDAAADAGNPHIQTVPGVGYITHDCDLFKPPKRRWYWLTEHAT